MPKRIEGVDVLRVLAILAVIALHANPFSGGSWGQPGLFSGAALISQFSRFAVPFFFTVSGYFWGVKINAGAAVLRTSLSMAKRIAVVFVAWSLI